MEADHIGQDCWDSQRAAPRQHFEVAGAGAAGAVEQFPARLPFGRCHFDQIQNHHLVSWIEYHL